MSRAERDTPTPRKIIQTIKALGECRDGLLVGASVIYLAGFCAWSIAAWLNGMGSVPAIEAQYFVVGVPVLLFLGAMTVGVGWLGRLALEWWPAYFVRVTPSGQWLIFLGLFTLLMVSSYGWIPQFLRWILRLPSEANAAIPSEREWLFFVISVVSILFIRSPGSPRWKHLRRVPFEWYAAVFIHVHVPALLALALWFYVSRLYIEIPQALGGGRPRTAQLEVLADQVSSDTLRELSEAADAALTKKVVRTRDVQVLSTVGETVLLRLYSKDTGQEQKRLEIHRKAITVVVWKDAN